MEKGKGAGGKPIKRIKPFLVLDTVLSKGENASVHLCVREDDLERKVLYSVKIYEGEAINEDLAAKLDRFKKVYGVIGTHAGSAPESGLSLLDFVVSKSSNTHYLVYPYANCGTLANFLNDGKTLPEPDIRSLLLSIIKPLQYLYSKNIIHTMLSSDHILLLLDHDNYEFKLSGLEHCVLAEDVGSVPGTEFYYSLYAPGIMKEEERDMKEFDRIYAYSFGLLAYNLLVGGEGNSGEDLEVIRNIEYIPGISRQLKHFIYVCLNKIGDSAWTLDDLLHTDFCQNRNDILINISYLPDRYIHPDAIGRGSYGKVARYFDKVTKQEVAIKTVNVHKCKTDKEVELLRGEVEILREMRDSSFVVRLIDSFTFQKKIYIVMELINGKSLGDFLLGNQRSLTEDEIAIVAWSTANALLEMHKFKKIMHRDVKAENILVSIENNRIIGAKLSDFGVSRKYAEEIKGKTLTGTKDYMAPEVMQVKEKQEEDQFYNEKADVWSYGVLLFFLATKKTPKEFFGEAEYVKKMKGRELLIQENFGIFTQDFITLLSACFEYDPAKRYSMDQLVEHEWFSFLKKGIKMRTTIEPYIVEEKNLIDNSPGRRSYKCTTEEGKQRFTMVIYDSYKQKGNAAKIERGIYVWKFLYTCKSIAKLVENFQIKDDLYIIREYCDDLTLTQKVRKGIASEEILLVAVQIAHAIKEMHARHILHRGINPDSVAVIEGEGKCERAVIKDFDLARVAYSVVQSSVGSDNIYIAPEYTKCDTSINKVFLETDIWSYGMVLYFMNYGEHPDKRGNTHSTMKKSDCVVKVGAPRIPELDSIMAACVKVNPQERPSIEAIIKEITKL